MPNKNLDWVWSSLESEVVAPWHQRVQRWLDLPSRRDLYLAIDVPTRRRMLVLRVGETDLDSRPREESKGLELRLEAREGEPLELQLLLGSIEDQGLFDILVEDIAASVDEATSDRDAARRFVSRFEDWRALFQGRPSELLSQEQRIGLWGELWLLAEVLTPAVGVGDAIKCWSGPLGANHDFSTLRWPLRSSSTSSNSLSRVRIANERQLESGPEGLVLCALRVVAHPTNGTSLASAVETLLNAANSAGAGEAARSRLINAGYREAHAEAYRHPHYTLAESMFLNVVAPFPRLTGEDLPDGLSKVSYELALAGTEPFRIDPASLKERLGGHDDA